MVFRKATIDDCDLFFKWANDKEVRANAFNSKPIIYEEHVQWFSKKILSLDCFLYICYEKDIPIGQIRVDIENNVGIIAYSIDSQNRGKGYGTKMLEMIVDQIKKEDVKISILKGKVKYENIASQKAFEKAGYECKNNEKYIEYFKNIC